ncbi:hypothetical protein EB008_01190 [bacterium]|nr:hypothetical protein [bacterium]
MKQTEVSFELGSRGLKRVIWGGSRLMIEWIENQKNYYAPGKIGEIRPIPSMLNISILLGRMAI